MRTRRSALATAATVWVVALLFGSGCARLVARKPTVTTHDAAAMIAAGAAREARMSGMRLTLTVKATSGPPAARVTSPAYLAITDLEHLHLQVLSPFGVTVLDVMTGGDAFTLVEPMRNRRREGRIDLAALAAGTVGDDDRMLVALAVLFRSKMETGRCRASGPDAVACAIAPDLTAIVTFDRAMHVVREEYRGVGGRPVLVATLEEYAPGEREGLPGRITVTDGSSDAALVIKVVRAQGRA